MNLKEYLIFRTKTFIKAFQILKHFHLFLFVLISLIVFIFYNNPFILLTIIILITFSLKNLKSSLFILLALILSVSITNFWIHTFNNELKNLESLQGRIIEPPSNSEFESTFIVNVEGLKGNVYVKTPKSLGLNIGDFISFKNNIDKVDLDNEFDHYLFTKGTWYKSNIKSIKLLSKNTDILINLRKDLISSLSSLSPKATNLTAGILLGVKDNLGKNDKEALNKTGTSHIISASGFNVMIVFILVKSLTERLNKNIQFLICSLCCIIYVLVIGWYILPARRALYMLILGQFGVLQGRQSFILFYLLLASFLISIEYPFYLINISFLLSFFSTFSLFTFANKIEAFFSSLPNLISSNLSATLAAIIGTAPISILFFDSWSIIAPVANILVLPLTPLIMYSGAILIIVKLANLTILTQLISTFVNILNIVFWEIVNTLNNLTTHSPPNFLILFVFLLFLVLIIREDKKRIYEKYFIYKIGSSNFSYPN